MEAAITVRMSVHPPAKFTERTDWGLWISRFERYVKEAKVPDLERVKELLPLLEDEQFRLVVQNGLLESTDYAAVQDKGGTQRQSVPVQEQTHPPATNTKQAAPEQSHHRARKAKSGKRRHRRSSSSESSDTSSSSSSSSRSSSSSSSESSNSDARGKKRKSKRHKRNKRHSKSRDSSFLNAPFTTIVPTPSRREVRRIKRGKYAHFEKLLSPLDDLPSLPGGKQKISKYMRQVCDLSSWLEAWNIYVAIRVQIAPKTALEQIKYQSIICQLFSVHSTAAALKYDKLFRQAAARNKQQTLHWDALKEDLLVW